MVHEVQVTDLEHCRSAFLTVDAPNEDQALGTILAMLDPFQSPATVSRYLEIWRDQHR